MQDWADCHESHVAWQSFVKNFCTEFRDKPTKGLLADYKRQADGRTDMVSQYGVSYFVRNDWTRTISGKGAVLHIFAFVFQ